MTFTAPSWVPSITDLPDVPIFEFMFDEKYGRAPLESSLDPYVCSISGKTISPKEQKERVESLAQALASELHWEVNKGTEYEKVISVFALNTIDIPTVHWAVHRLNGICAPINSGYTVSELTSLLQKSKAKALFTVLPLLETAKAAARNCGIPLKNIYILDMPGDGETPSEFISISQLFERSLKAPKLEPVRWAKGQSARQCAYLSHSSGTSGPPKLAAVSHQNIVANVAQITLFEEKARGGKDARMVVLGLLPASHVYGVVLISHMATYRGDKVVVLPKFDMHHMLESIEKYRINTFSIVPPIIVQLGRSPELLHRYDLSSINTVLSGGAPLDDETLGRLEKWCPSWTFRQGYGLTEIGACISLTDINDPWAGSAGNLLPGLKVKLLREDGSEVAGLDERGEVYAQGPGVILGYFEDPVATNETFVERQDGRWLRTGDIALFRRSPKNSEHIFIVDRVKEVIKVKGLQVVPAELESCLLGHPAVAACAVIGIPHEKSGEVPKAFVQRSTVAHIDLPQSKLVQELVDKVKIEKSRHKWLVGGIEFVDEIPKSPSGKILRRLLRDREKARGGRFKAVEHRL